MQALRADGRLDLGALRALVPVSAVVSGLGGQLHRAGDGFRGPGICHGGDNTTAFHVSADDQQWYCHRCGCGGDAIQLVREVERCTFPEAVARIARIGGLVVNGLPRLNSAEAKRRARLVRRRAALTRWRNVRLNGLAVALCKLTASAEWASEMLRKHHGDEGGQAPYWGIFEQAHAALAVAEWVYAQLSTRDESEWARLWLQEHGGGEVVNVRRAG